MKQNAGSTFPDERRWDSNFVRLLTTTDHKTINELCLSTSFAWFLAGGIMALLMRSEPANPGMQFVNDEVYNQLFTMHGTIMLLLFATTLFFGFANMIMPLQIGSPDVAFPRLNMLSYWLYFFGGMIVALGMLTSQGAADWSWTGTLPGVGDQLPATSSDAGRQAMVLITERTLRLGVEGMDQPRWRRGRQREEVLRRCTARSLGSYRRLSEDGPARPRMRCMPGDAGRVRRDGRRR